MGMEPVARAASSGWHGTCRRSTLRRAGRLEVGPLRAEGVSPPVLADDVKQSCQPRDMCHVPPSPGLGTLDVAGRLHGWPGSYPWMSLEVREAWCRVDTR